MDGWIKQSTAHTFQMGPFLDDTDGKTVENALTIVYTDIFISKNGAGSAPKNDTTDLTGTSDTRGYYDCVLNNTDTNTVGTLKIVAHVVGALPVWHTFMVLPANVYDSLTGGDLLQVDIEAIKAQTDKFSFTGDIPPYLVNAQVKGQDDIDFGALQKASITASVPTPAQIQAEMEEDGASILDYIRDKLPTHYIMGSSDQADHDIEFETLATYLPLMASEVDICSRALTKLGAEPITSFDDESKRAKLCRDFYPRVRDAVLRAHPWNCAVMRTELAREAATPLFDFSYQYQLPVNPYCLRILSIDGDPEYKVEGRSILSNADSVKIKYVARITNPGLFDSLLSETIEVRLAAELAIPITADKALAKEMWLLYEAKLRDARTMDGMEGTIEPYSSNVLVDVR